MIGLTGISQAGLIFLEATESFVEGRFGVAVRRVAVDGGRGGSKKVEEGSAETSVGERSEDLSSEK